MESQGGEFDALVPGLQFPRERDGHIPAEQDLLVLVATRSTVL
jgi:hypothetical protein